MLIPQTDVYGGISQVSTSAFNDVLPYLILIIGVILAFYIIEVLIGIMRSDKQKEKDIYAMADREIARAEKLHD